MLIFLFIILVWLKIVAGDMLIFFWLWLARDRCAKGVAAAVNYIGAGLFWLIPWAAFLWHESSLYAGHCGLRQGVHACDLAEFLWSRLDWVRPGLLLDISLFVGIVVLMTRARVVRTSELALGQAGNPPSQAGRTL